MASLNSTRYSAHIIILVLDVYLTSHGYSDWMHRESCRAESSD